MNSEKLQEPLDAATFQRMRKWYVLALAGIALTIISAQILIQKHLNSQLDDSRIINVAGRQRAYSQKLVKEILLLKESKGKVSKESVLEDLKQTLYVWTTSHKGLQFGNDSMGLKLEKNPDILALFNKIAPHHIAMVEAAEDVLSQFGVADESISNRYQEDLAILLRHERTFLDLMDTMVNEYDQRSKKQLQNLKYKEYLLLGFSLLILLLEMLFIFRPLSIQIRRTIKNLMESRVRSEKHATDIQKLFQEKEKSLLELQELNFVIDNAALFASAKNDGSVVFMSKKFLELLGCEKEDLNKPLSEILTVDDGQQQYFKEILKSNRQQLRSEEVKVRTKNGDDLWLDMS
ncbi:MAG: type IV pili methyl-accepting chemotaxis transducer N-terminal domain-containing protein, partial [Flavobacteriales bacterium]